MSTPFRKVSSQKFLVKGVFLFTFVFSMFFSVTPVRAGYWGESLMATLLEQTLDTIKRSIEGAILGTLKVTAIELLNSKVGQLIGGSSSGGALFITDWNNFLYETPAQQARLYMNDFFTLTTRGKYASANYVGIGDVSGNVSGNYPAYLVKTAQSSIGGFPEDKGLSYSLDEYTPNPELMFREGDYRAFNAFISNPANNPFGYQLMAQGAYEQKLAQAQQQALAKAQSGGGFIGPERNGITIAPAATIAAMASNVQNIGNNLIAAASNPAEFLSGVVGALVNKTVTSLVQRGVGQIQANIQKEIRSVDNKVFGALNDANRALGPAAQFTREVSQRTSVRVNTYAQPPPTANCTVDQGC